MSTVLSPAAGVALLLATSLCFILLAMWVSRNRRQHRAEFLLASRSMGLLPTAMSVAASWIWAPSLFVAAQKAYEQGAAGLFWFVVPNFTCLVLFAPLAHRLRQLLPLGYTLPQYMRQRHGRGVHALYLVQFFGLQICCFAVQVLAGSTLVAWLTGLHFSLVATVLVGTTIIYATLGGMRASIATDFLQMAVILGILAVLIPWAVLSAGGPAAVAGGFGSRSGTLTLLDPWVAYSFGIPVTISLLSGPIGDQMQWQRSFVVLSPRRVRQTFICGAVIFIIVPLSLSVLGFLAANPAVSAGWDIPKPQLVGPTTVANLLPPFMSAVFALMVLSSLYATLDSVLCAVSALSSTDLVRVVPEDNDLPEHSRGNLLVARAAMVAAALLGWALAHIPGLQVLHLFLFYGTWRASTMIPTVLTLYWPALSSRAVLWAILGSLVFGAPVLALGNAIANPHLSVAGSLAVVSIGAGVCFFGTWLSRTGADTELRLGEIASAARASGGSDVDRERDGVTLAE